MHFGLFASSVAQTLLGTANIHGKATKEQLPNRGDHFNIEKAVSYNTNSTHLCLLMNQILFPRDLLWQPTKTIYYVLRGSVGLIQ